jgi:hypothetical protein
MNKKVGAACVKPSARQFDLVHFSDPVHELIPGQACCAKASFSAVGGVGVWLDGSFMLLQ